MRRNSGAPRPGISASARALRERRLWPHLPRVEPLRLRHIPLAVATLCFIAGIALRRLAPPASRPAAFFFLAAAALTAITIVALRRSPRIVLAPVAALWIAAGLWCAQIEPIPTPQAALRDYTDGLSRMVDARIVRIRALPRRSEPAPSAKVPFDFESTEWQEPGEPAYSIDLAVNAIEYITPDISTMVPASGGVRITVTSIGAAAIVSQLQCGDRITAPVRLREPQRFRDPGVFQYADYLAADDPDAIGATSTVPAAKLQRLPAAHTRSLASLRCSVFATQSWAAARLLGFVRSPQNRRMPAALRLTPEDAATLNATLFGDRSGLTHALRLGFERTGSFHLFVVSGMHVALLAGILFWITRRLRLQPWLASLITVSLTTGYALLTGFGVPVRRALLMSAVFLAARLLFRERIALNALAAAALAVLVWSPHALFESSFQMTFLALVAIAGIAAPIAERALVPRAFASGGMQQRWRDTTLPPRLAQLRTMLQLWGISFGEMTAKPLRFVPPYIAHAFFWLVELALVGAVAECVMVLPMATVFHRATIFALPANMLSIPLVAIIAPLGLITFGLALLTPWIALVPSACTALLLHAIIRTIHLVAQSRAADLRTPGPPLIAALLALTCVAFCCWAVRRSARWALAPLALLPLAVILALWPYKPLAHRGELEVSAIDVGQGDSLLVVGPSGSTMLIDAGGPTGAAAHAENATGVPAFDIGEQVVSPYLWTRQIRRLDVLVLSHAHSDHMGGMPSVLRNFRPRELWVAVDPASDAYQALLAEAAELGTTVRHLRAPDDIAWDGTSIQVLAPTSDYHNAGPPVNNDSLVLRMQYGKASVLFEGDAEAASEHQMVEASNLAASTAHSASLLGPVTLLKVAHHGSRTSTTPALLAAAAPQYAVISVGRNNTFGHPRGEILSRLGDAHVKVFRTDEFGLTSFLLDHDGKISALPDASHP